MSNEPLDGLHPDGTLFIVSGPSGAGKTTLIERARRDLEPIGLHLHFSVSHTTRRPRLGEENGRDYHFVSGPEFERMAASAEFLEWAHVHGQMYGTSKAEVQCRLDRAEDVILDIDVQGARLIAENAELRPHSLSVFVFPPSFEELETRLRRRNLNSEDEINLRLRKAYTEIEEGLSFYDYFIINDDFDIAAESLKAAMIARKLKSSAAMNRLMEMARCFKEKRDGRSA